MSYHELKRLAKHKGAATSIVWVREAQMGADQLESEEKLQAVAEREPTSSHEDVTRFGIAALESAKKFLEDNKVTD